MTNALYIRCMDMQGVCSACQRFAAERGIFPQKAGKKFDLYFQKAEVSGKIIRKNNGGEVTDRFCSRTEITVRRKRSCRA